MRLFYDEKKRDKNSKSLFNEGNNQDIVINLKITENGYENEFTRYIPIQRHIAVGKAKII